MAYQDGFDRLLSELGKKIGMDTLAFDENGFCHITVDNEFPVSLRRDDENHRLVLLGQISEDLPEDLSRALAGEMLAQALAPLRDNGIGIGYEPTTRNVILHQCVPLADLNLERIQAVLGNFFENVGTWRKRVVERRHDVAEQTRSDFAGPAGFL